MSSFSQGFRLLKLEVSFLVKQLVRQVEFLDFSTKKFYFLSEKKGRFYQDFVIWEKRKNGLITCLHVNNIQFTNLKNKSPLLFKGNINALSYLRFFFILDKFPDQKV